MNPEYRDTLFSSYHGTHNKYLDQKPDADNIQWFRQYLAQNYLDQITHYERDSATILEIGCNRGYLLSVFGTLGFKRVYGVDLSPEDVEACKKIAPHANVVCGDAVEFLALRKEEFDVILLKAVLEHMEKAQVMPFLQHIKRALRKGGTVIIDVPNMDWLLAQHERYMDFTHELGFTRESLSQVMRNTFDDVSVFKGKAVPDKRLLVRLMRPLIVYGVNVIFRFVGEGMHDTWWDNRSIIGVARK
jgi:2-polyprenyl-3-methyl-5-hydroxy-6-metoxy-1,4-benzoquinol methylase